MRHTPVSSVQPPAASRVPTSVAELNSNMTPAPSPAPAMPAVSTVSMRIVGMTISLAGIATR